MESYSKPHETLGYTVFFETIKIVRELLKMIFKVYIKKRYCDNDFLINEQTCITRLRLCEYSVPRDRFDS